MANDIPGFAPEDSRTERILRDYGAKFELVVLRLDQLGVNFSRLGHLTNPYRGNTIIDDEASSQYSLAMQWGDKFPPLVVGRQDGKLRLLGGFHRGAGATKARLIECWAYVCDVDDNLAKTLGVVLNTHDEQVRLTLDEKYAIAVDLVVNDGWKQKDVERLCLLPSKNLGEHVAAYRATKRAEELRAHEIVKLSMTSLQHLNKIRDTDEFLAAGRAMVRRGGTDDHKAFVTSILAEGNAVARREIIDTWQPTKGKGKPSPNPRPQPPLQTTKRYLSQIMGLSEYVLLREVALHRDEATDLIERMNAAGYRLLSFAGKLREELREEVSEDGSGEPVGASAA